MVTRQDSIPWLWITAPALRMSYAWEKKGQLGINCDFIKEKHKIKKYKNKNKIKQKSP